MPVSLNAVSTAFGGTAPHGLKELYGVVFDGGGSAPASGEINLNAFDGKSPYSPTTLITSTISPSPLVYNLDAQAYTLNIAGPLGPQTTSTPQSDIRGIDVHPNDNVTLRIYDSRYSGYSQLRFTGNYLSTVTNSVNRTENNTFNTRFRPASGYTYVTANNIWNASAVISWYIPLPSTVTKLEFYYTKTQWGGFSITI